MTLVIIHFKQQKQNKNCPIHLHLIILNTKSHKTTFLILQKKKKKKKKELSY